MVEPLPNELTLTPFHVRDAVALGIRPAQLRRAGLVAPYRGTRIATAQDPTFEQLVDAYATRMGRDQCFSHLTAARIWGMRLPRWSSSEPLHVTAILPARAPRLVGVVGHQARPGIGVTVIRGIPVTSVQETWCELATLLTLDDLIVAGDAVVRRQLPLATMDDLVAAVDSWVGRRGARKLRIALTCVRPGTDSARETRLRLLLARAGLPEPEVNGIISKPGARRLRRGDLVFREAGVVVEYEGEHHTGRATYAADIERYEELREWRFVRVIKEHFVDPSSIVRRVREALESA